MNRHHLSYLTSTLVIVVWGAGFWYGWFSMPPYAHAIFGYVMFGCVALSIALLMAIKLHALWVHDHMMSQQLAKRAGRPKTKQELIHQKPLLERLIGSVSKKED